MAEVNTVTYETLGDVDEDTVQLFIPKDALNVEAGDEVGIRVVDLAPDLKLVVLGGTGDSTATMAEIAGDPDEDHQTLPVPKSVLGVEASAPGSISSFTKYEPASGPVLVAALG